VMSDTMFCSVFCIFTSSHCCDVRYDVLFCLLYLHTFTLLWCPIRCSDRTSYRTSQQCEGVKIQTTEQNIVSDITIVWRCEDTKDRTEHRIGHHNSVKMWRYKRQNRTSYRTSQQCETLLWCPIRCSVLSFVSSHLHTIVMSDTMFCSVVCIFTPSHYCNVWYDVLFCRLYVHTFTLLWCLSDITIVWRCEDTNDRTEHRIRHHNSVKVWRYKR
jgi:hypothetical protein